MSDSSAELLNLMLAQQAQEMASFDALLDLVEQLAVQAGVPELEGLPLRQWWADRKTRNLKKMLLEFEDKNPMVAAHLLEWIEQSGAAPFDDL